MRKNRWLYIYLCLGGVEIGHMGWPLALHMHYAQLCTMCSCCVLAACLLRACCVLAAYLLHACSLCARFVLAACLLRIKVLLTFWKICGHRNLQHTDANLLKRYGCTWIAGIINKGMQTGFVFIRLTYLFKLFDCGKSANGFITNYLPYLRTSLYATVITLFLYPDFQ